MNFKLEKPSTADSQTPDENQTQAEKEHLNKTEEFETENISRQLHRLAESMEELALVIARNKFPRVRFNSDELGTLGRAEVVEGKAISNELANLTLSIDRIRMPEDRRDMMELEPRNFRSVIAAMEELRSRLSLLKKSLEDSQSESIQAVAPQTSRLQMKISSKIEDFDKALSALRRIRD